MAITVDNPREQIKLLKSSILMSLSLSNGYGAIQALLRKAFVAGFISNPSQQKLLSICEPLRSETTGQKITPDMVTEIERVFKAEISTCNKVLNPD